MGQPEILKLLKSIRVCNDNGDILERAGGRQLNNKVHVIHDARVYGNICASASQVMHIIVASCSFANRRLAKSNAVSSPSSKTAGRLKEWSLQGFMTITSPPHHSAHQPYPVHLAEPSPSRHQKLLHRSPPLLAPAQLSSGPLRFPHP